MSDPKTTLEGTTLLKKFQAPVLLVTYEGIKKVNIEKVEKYELHTSLGTYHKTDVVFALLAGTADQLGAHLRLNKKIEAKQLRTDKKRKKRDRIKGNRPMTKLVEKRIKVTLRSGHVLIGIPVEHNEWNFTLNVNDQIVLVYRHAVYQVEVVNTAA